MKRFEQQEKENKMKILAVIDTNVIVSALSQEDSYLVTGNIKHFPKKPFIVTPTEMVAIISEMQEIGNRILSEAGARYGKRGKGL